MTNEVILVELLKVIGGLIVLLTMLIAWIGTRIHARLDDINKTLGRVDKDLTQQIAKLNTRISLVESTCSHKHQD